MCTNVHVRACTMHNNTLMLGTIYTLYMCMYMYMCTNVHVRACTMHNNTLMLGTSIYSLLSRPLSGKPQSHTKGSHIRVWLQQTKHVTLPATCY